MGRYLKGGIMKKKILFCTGEGIGNTVECAPVLNTLKSMGYTVDMWHAFGAFSIKNNLFPLYVDKYFVGPKIIGAINLDEYEGMVSTIWTQHVVKNIPLKLLAPIKGLRMDRSEVDIYLDIARALGAKEEDIRWTGECDYIQRKEVYDVVIADGCNKGQPAQWEIKSYPHYEEVVKILKEKDYSVASIGTPNEYVKGTVDKTGLSIMDAGGLIKNAKVLLSNDSGMYHYANTLGTTTVVIFTATSIEKNYDERFHVYTTILCEDLECRPCQAGQRWKSCDGWMCQDIDPASVAHTVEEKLHE